MSFEPKVGMRSQNGLRRYPWAPPRRVGMTIIAGLLGPDFVVLGSDSEEGRSVGKATVRKIAKVEKGLPVECRCLIGGAGNGNFIDLAVQEFHRQLVSPFSIHSVGQLLEDVVTSIHADRIDKLPAPQRSDAQFELLCGIWVAKEGIKLLKVGRGFHLV